MHTRNDVMVTVTSSLSTVVPYEVTVTTGDVSEAGTDCKIFITVFGTKGSTAPIELEKNEDRFERARTDVIKVCAGLGAPGCRLGWWGGGGGKA